MHLTTVLTEVYSDVLRCNCAVLNALRCRVVVTVKLPLQIGTNRGPLGRHDAIDTVIAQRAVRGALMATQYAVELGSQTFNGTTALVIQKMGAKLHRQALEDLKGMGQQKKLGFCVQLRSLDA